MEKSGILATYEVFLRAQNIPSIPMTNVVPRVTKIRIPCDQTRYGGKIGKLKNMKGSPCFMVKRLDHSHILIDGDLKRKAILKERGDNDVPWLAHLRLSMLNEI
ncbi:hypothetical protein MAR_000105 [Mya arenaria]|uniref:Uncharacterized protein n=1 Tax=Mya arenaria TaxID=6604 RepID=A0ABY7FB79_MYAAR|nr:hypothetical protein MAR_000105 [Mya arenaria]